MQFGVIARTLLVAAAVGAPLTEAAASPVVNGGFESGSLVGWTSTIFTDQSVVSINPTIAMASVGSLYSPLGGAFSALLVTVSGATPGGAYGSCSVDIWNYSCPQPLPFVEGGGVAPAHSLVPFGGAIGRWATTITQDVTVAAGHALRWDWQLFGEAACGGSSFSCVDNGWFFATDGVTTAFQYAPTSGSASPGRFEFGNAGTWSVYFGVGQTEDFQAYSALMLDNVSLVPSPGTMSLVLAGLVAIVHTRRRKSLPTL